MRGTLMGQVIDMHMQVIVIIILLIHLIVTILVTNTLHMTVTDQEVAMLLIVTLFVMDLIEVILKTTFCKTAMLDILEISLLEVE